MGTGQAIAAQYACPPVCCDCCLAAHTLVCPARRTRNLLLQSQLRHKQRCGHAARQGGKQPEPIRAAGEDDRQEVSGSTRASSGAHAARQASQGVAAELAPSQGSLDDQAAAALGIVVLQQQDDCNARWQGAIMRVRTDDEQRAPGTQPQEAAGGLAADMPPSRAMAACRAPIPLQPSCMAAHRAPTSCTHPCS